MFRVSPLCIAPSHLKPKARRKYPVCWVVLKWNEMFQVLGNQREGGAQQSPGLRQNILNGSADSTSEGSLNFS